MHDIHAEKSTRPGVGSDTAIAALATEQHGVVARRQLITLGLGRGAIAERLRKQRLHRIHQGVYAVGHRKLSHLGWWMAAVLACGPGAVLSHRCAAASAGILEGWPTTVDVIAPRELHSRPGVRVHLGALADDERTERFGIPVTTVARTLLDLAAVLDVHALNRALERAEALGLADAVPLAALIERHAGQRGTASLRAALDEGLRPAVTRSDLERRFLTFVDDAGLPRPLTNVVLDGIEVDCAWPERRVVVELDGRAYHRTMAAFERDRARDRRLAAAGWRPIRVTDRALRDEPARLRSELTALVAAVQARSA
jgi:predicted transcriptional regulator of viral defense system